MADMTAADLNELVTRPSPGLPDGWPEGARPPLLEYKACGGERGWFDDDSYTAVSLAVLAHVGSAVEWWIEQPFSLGQAPNLWHRRGTDVYGFGSWTGPSYLHAIDAAVRAVGGGG